MVWHQNWPFGKAEKPQHLLDPFAFWKLGTLQPPVTGINGLTWLTWDKSRIHSRFTPCESEIRLQGMRWKAWFGWHGCRRFEKPLKKIRGPKVEHIYIYFGGLPKSPGNYMGITCFWFSWKSTVPVIWWYPPGNNIISYHKGTCLKMIFLISR